MQSLKLLVALVLSLFISLTSTSSQAQTGSDFMLRGKIMDAKKNAVIGAEVKSLTYSATTLSDENGAFALNVPDSNQTISISSAGFGDEQISYTAGRALSIVEMKNSQKLDNVTVTKRRGSSEMNTLSVGNMIHVGGKELLKAACCNLSESFETTPSIDAGFTDAVSGFKQISMLGLSGPNVAFTQENIPDIRGLAAITGLTFTPGVWVESIQISKGTGSVVNGFEGVAGQINVELMKPDSENAPKLLLNGYQSTQGRTEGNLVWNKTLNNDWNTNILAHAKSNWLRVDDNNDGFLDQTLGETYVLANRWRHHTDNGFEFQIGAKGTLFDVYGGQKDFDKEMESKPSNPWGYANKITKGDVWAKIGKVFPAKPYKSMGLQLSGSLYNQESTYGVNEYAGKQQSLYANYIYQTIIGTTNHVIKLGASLQSDGYDETLNKSSYKRVETVPGAFVEYTYNYLDKLNIVAGLRGDYNNYYGGFATPRLHIRYAPDQYTAIRGSIGRAQRTVSAIAENLGYLASSRSFGLPAGSGSNMDKPFGLDPEVAWNMGVNALRKFRLNYRDGSFSVDYYYTHFENMAVVDLEKYNQVNVYNLDGSSFAHSFQAQLDYEPLRKLDVRLAYRFYDVRTTYDAVGLRDKPLVAKHRMFANLAYETNNLWKFDFTANWTGAARLPQRLVEGSLLASKSTVPFTMLSAQINKTIGAWQLYIGAENLTNIMQPQLIINSQNPYDTGFDAGLVYGSAMGRNLYAGFRYTLK